MGQCCGCVSEVSVSVVLKCHTLGFATSRLLSIISLHPPDALPHPVVSSLADQTLTGECGPRDLGYKHLESRLSPPQNSAAH